MNRYDTDGTDWDTYFLSHLSGVLLLMPKPVTVFSIFAKISIFFEKNKFPEDYFPKIFSQRGRGVLRNRGEGVLALGLVLLRSEHMKLYLELSDSDSQSIYSKRANAKPTN